MIYARVGGNIRSMRRKKGLTQKELGEKCNCSHQMISGIERGTKKVTLSMLDKIADALDCDMSYFIKFWG